MSNAPRSERIILTEELLCATYEERREAWIGYAISRAGLSRAAAEDAVQDAVARMLRHIGRPVTPAWFRRAVWFEAFRTRRRATVEGGRARPRPGPDGPLLDETRGEAGLTCYGEASANTAGPPQYDYAVAKEALARLPEKAHALIARCVVDGEPLTARERMYLTRVRRRVLK